jgi:hypothetical protein
MSAGVERVLVIRREGALRVDLLSVLRLWKREGLVSARFDPATGVTSDHRDGHFTPCGVQCASQHDFPRLA